MYHISHISSKLLFVGDLVSYNSVPFKSPTCGCLQALLVTVCIGYLSLCNKFPQSWCFNSVCMGQESGGAWSGGSGPASLRGVQSWVSWCCHPLRAWLELIHRASMLVLAVGTLALFSWASPWGCLIVSIAWWLGPPEQATQEIKMEATMPSVIHL